MTTGHFIDLAFPARGGIVPLDHGYALFGALCRVLPSLHEEATWGVHPIRGTRMGPGELALDSSSRVKLRMPAVDIARALALAGAGIELGGASIVLGAPQVFVLEPHTVLRSRFVTIKGFMGTPEEFAAAARRQLAKIDLRQDPERIDVTIGPRRIVRISEKTIVGFAAMLEGLDPDASLAVQIAGLGGRRHMGCGVFVPPGRRG